MVCTAILPCISLFGLPVQQISLLVIFILIFFFIIGIYWIPFALMIFNDMSWIIGAQGPFCENPCKSIVHICLANKISSEILL